MEKWRCRGNNTGAKVKVTEENAAPQKSSTESQPEKKKEKKWTFAGLLKRKSKQTTSSEQSNSLLSLTPNPTIYYSEQVKNVQTNPSKAADRDKSYNNYNKQTTGNATKKHESTDSMNLSNASTSAVAPPATIQSRNSESSDTGSKYSRRNRLKARIQAKRDRYYGDSSTDDEHSHYKSSNNSNSNCYINTNSIVNGNANITAPAAAFNPNNSLMRIQSEDSIYHHHHHHHHLHHHHNNNNNYHRRLIEVNKKTRGARTVRYMKRFYRDDTIDDHDGNIDVRIHPIYHHLSPVLQSHSNNYNYNYNNSNSNSNNGIVKKKADTLPSTNNLWTTTNNNNLLLKPPYYQAFCSEQNLLHVYPNNYNDNIKYQSDNLHGLNDTEVFNNEYAWPQPHEAKLTTATSNYNKSRGINCHVDNKSPPPPAPASSSVSPGSASVLAPQPPPRSTSVSRLHPVTSARHSHHLDLDIFTETNSCSGCSHNHHNHNHSCSQQLLPCESNVNYNSLDRIYATPKRRHRCCNRRVVRHPISEPFLLYKNNNSSSINNNNNNNNNNNTFSKKSHEAEDKMPEDPIVPKIKKKIVPKMKGYKSIYEQPLEKRRHSKNLEEALIELETIYNSLHLNEDEDLLDRAEQRSMEEYRHKIAITAAAKAGIGGSIKSSLDTSSSSSPSPSPSAASSYELNLWRNVNFDRHDNYSNNNNNHNNSHSHNNNNNNSNNNNDDEPRLKDDMAYRRMHQPERSASVDPSQSSLSRVSYLAASPSLLSYRDREYQIDNNYLLGNYINVSCNNEKPKNQRRGTPDLTLDDVVYRNITHANNTLRVIEPQPPFGIPLGPVTAAAESDYLHVEPKIKHTRSSLYIPKNEPDIVTDDLAFRNLRKDTNGKNKFANSMNNISFVPTRESMSRNILAGNCDLKKKRAVRSLSADLYGIIDKSNDDHHAWYKEFTKVNSSKLFPQDGALISSSSVGDLSIGNYNNDDFDGKDKNSELDINGNRPKSLYQAKIQVCVPHEEDGKVLRRQSCEREFMEMENCQTFNKKCRTLSSPYYDGGSFDVDVDEGDDGGEVVDTNEKVIEPSSDQELSEYKQLCHNLESLIKKTSEKVKKSVEEAKSNAMLLGSNRNSLSEFIEWEELLGEDESLKINKKMIEDEEDGKAKGEGKGNEVKEKIRMDKEELEKMIKEIKDDTKSEYKEPDQLLKLNIDDEMGTKVIDTEASCESYNSNKESLESVVKLVPSNDAQDNISPDDYDNSHVDYHARNNDVDCDDDKQPNAKEFHLDKQVPYLSCDSNKLNNDNNFDNDFKNLISSDSHTNIDDGVDVAAAGYDKKEPPALKQPETTDPNPSELEVHAGQKDDTEKTCRGRETTL